ncbi:hypothetical protein N7527_001648 [Penicillium freii]|nr:hypothetical protein N7527_001648 [Penicillium freii]
MSRAFVNQNNDNLIYFDLYYISVMDLLKLLMTTVTISSLCHGRIGHSHIGLLFFDQDLITQVENTYPYNTNTVSITENADDHVVIVETEDSNSDPFFEYALLGETVEDGLFAWITLGVNASASYEPSNAATLTSSGGVSE